MRTGECAPGCGACCRDVKVEVGEQYLAPDVAKWLALHGLEVKQLLPGRYFLRIPTPCQSLTEDGMCGVHGTDRKPEMCNRFPASIYDLKVGEVEDVCTYTFEEVASVHE